MNLKAIFKINCNSMWNDQRQIHDGLSLVNNIKQEANIYHWTAGSYLVTGIMKMKRDLISSKGIEYLKSTLY